MSELGALWAAMELFYSGKWIKRKLAKTETKTNAKTKTETKAKTVKVVKHTQYIPGNSYSVGIQVACMHGSLLIHRTAVYNKLLLANA